MRSRRPTLVLWHRWFGLLAAGWLFLLGLTGSIMVFTHEIDAALNPDLMIASGPGVVPLDRVAAAVARAAPGYRAAFLYLPTAPGATINVSLAQRRPDAPGTLGSGYWQAFVDPASGRVLGLRNFDAIDLSRRGIMNFIYQFHSSLHLGAWMTWTIGLIAMLWTLDHAVSAVLAFPNRKKWRDSFRIRRGVAGHKRLLDWHRAGGLWMFPITLTLAVSGVYFNWPGAFMAGVEAVSPVTATAANTRATLTQPLDAPPLGFDAAIASAATVAPSARPEGIGYDPATGLYNIHVADRRDIDDFGARVIAVDAANGAVVSDFHPASGSAGDVIVAWQFPLHSGKAFGWWGRIAICLAGIMLCVFVVTGVSIWSRKRSARARGKSRAQAVAAPQMP